MNLNIKYCNSIEEGNIKIDKDRLNIKYAINGTGKTTITKAIEYYVKVRKGEAEQEIFERLQPFKYCNVQEGETEKIPAISGAEEIESIMIFNEDYINQYVYLPDELVKNSFDVFVRNQEYDQRMSQINELISNIGDTFRENQHLEDFIKDLKELNECFGKPTRTGGYSASSAIGKGLNNGNKIENIPEGLLEYREYIQSDLNAKWLKWQMSGKDYLELSHKCPYCTSGIESKKETILKVSSEYDSKVIEHLTRVMNVFERLGMYFTEEVSELIKQLTKNVTGISDEHKQFLAQIRQQVEILITKLEGVKSLGFNTLKDVDKVMVRIRQMKIDLLYMPFLNSTATIEKVNVVNASLDEILEKAGVLQGEIAKQKRAIQTTISTYRQEINNFLKYAGYKYSVDIEEEQDVTYKMKLKHNEYTNTVQDVKLHLSYGEKNAFALVLFMYEAIKNQPNLIILDDPISSFDKNKKFAIVEMLFRGRNSFRGKTVLMLTHDFDPIIDMIYTLPDLFEPVPRASFLENKYGELREIAIEKTDIQTFIEIARKNIQGLDESVNKLIYLRRLYEIYNEKLYGYQLISNIFHKRNEPEWKSSEGSRKMTDEEIELGGSEINSWMLGSGDSSDYQFDYATEYNKVSNTYNMIQIYKRTSNNYEKLQLYRVINNDNNENCVIRKFVNGTFHIENDYLFQLNPCKYEIVPQYIIDECDKDIAEIEQQILEEGRAVI